MSLTNTPQQAQQVLQEQQVNGSCHREMNSTNCAKYIQTDERTPLSIVIIKMVAPETHHRLVVLPLTTIGVLLRTTRTARGISFSATGIRTTTSRTTPSTCVQCGLFDLFLYFSIFLFNFSAVRQKNFFLRSSPAKLATNFGPTTTVRGGVYDLCVRL